MNKDINNLPSLKEIELDLFHFLQEKCLEMMSKILEELDQWIMENRDHKRYEYKDRRGFKMETLFGTLEVKRRYYRDRHQQHYVALLDQILGFEGKDSISPFLEETAVDWAVKGPSFRDTRDRLKDFLGYRVMSHEKIRQRVLAIKKDGTPKKDVHDLKQAKVIFLEIDGVHASLQREKTSSKEVKVATMHEGWEPESPGSDRYRLKNKRYTYTTKSSQVFWDQVNELIENHYEITPETWIVYNGDAASWVREGVEQLPRALYVYDQYHLKKWIKQALRKRSKKERKKAYKAADQHDPLELLVALSEAEKAETDEQAREEIAQLRTFIFENQEAIRDYRERLQEQGVKTEGMRPMGSAESNMDLFANRLKKRGYSWSIKGLDAMVNGVAASIKGELRQRIMEPGTVSESPDDDNEDKSFSLKQLLKQKTQQVIGTVPGHMPILDTKDQSKPYVDVLRSLAGLR